MLPNLNQILIKTRLQSRSFGFIIGAVTGIKEGHKLMKRNHFQQSVTSTASRHYNNVKFRAAKRGQEFSLTRAEFDAVRKSPCEMCGHCEGPNSVDRINSEGGYTSDNVQALCIICNQIKSNFDNGELLSHINTIVQHQLRKGR